jgi:hypothetical protein
MRSLPIAAFALAATLSATPAFALAPAPARIRGTIVSLDGNTLVVNTRSGQKVSVALATDAVVTESGTTKLSDVHSGSFIGTTTILQPDGTMKALEIHVFPESMRGTGAGSRPWDLAPASTMTNGTVGQIQGTNTRSVTVKYPDGQKTVTVPADVPIVALEPGTRAELTPGAHVFVIGMKAADGALSASRVTVGKDGLEPPM